MSTLGEQAAANRDLYTGAIVHSYTHDGITTHGAWAPLFDGLDAGGQTLTFEVRTTQDGTTYFGKPTTVIVAAGADPFFVPVVQPLIRDAVQYDLYVSSTNANDTAVSVTSTLDDLAPIARRARPLRHVRISDEQKTKLRRNPNFTLEGQKTIYVGPGDTTVIELDCSKLLGDDESLVDIDAPTSEDPTVLTASTVDADREVDHQRALITITALDVGGVEGIVSVKLHGPAGIEWIAYVRVSVVAKPVSDQ